MTCMRSPEALIWCLLLFFLVGVVAPVMGAAEVMIPVEGPHMDVQEMQHPWREGNVTGDAGGFQPARAGFHPAANQAALATTVMAYFTAFFSVGLSILVVAVLFTLGRGTSRGYRYALPRGGFGLLATAYGISGSFSAIFAVGALSTFNLVTMNSISGGGRAPDLTVAFVGICLVYLAFSSFALAYASFRRLPVIYLLRAHPLPALTLLLVGLVGAVPLFRGPGGDLLAVPVLLASAIFPVLQMRGLTVTERGSATITGGDEGPLTVVGDEEAVPPRSPSGFPAGFSGRYADVTYVGRGGNASVFRAVRRTDGEVVAVKIPLGTDELTGRYFLKEMRIWEGLDHPNIVRLYALNILPVPFVEMEYVEQSLQEIEKPVSPTVALKIARGVAAGLGYAHERGVIHRDIKPANLLIAPGWVPKITDWGLGKEVADTGTTTVVAFSLDYAAPEQVSPSQFGSPGKETDIFQFGVVLYELLTGRRPFPGEGIGEVSMAILTADPPLPSTLDPSLACWDRVVERCLAKDPKHRYRSVADLLAALDEVEEE
ncbi:serine/threonine protein kinase [Methanofollis formosanus]|uniref:Serine/threonine protein kinase n=1 Tax=Methanofollis formosanus TaxID=299308 RepID=A0A8G0ZZ91_9EURY|nr:serine/threonine-protein kinase [Methanofollis formosanus]QYZ78290.1 serine/threonine protein kinase [Methanofollis formosanus]